MRAAGGIRRDMSPGRRVIASAPESDTEAVTYKVGDKVEAKFGGGDKWYKGVIVRANRDGSYAIDYEDGDKELRVPTSLMRAAGRPRSRSPGKGGFDTDDDLAVSFKRGDHIEARYRGGRRWLPGRVFRDNRDGTYDIRYDDGDEEKGVASSMIRAKPRGRADTFDSDADVAVNYKVGDKVEAKFGGGDKWYKGVIVRANRDGSYAIDYEDGDKELRVPTSLMRAAGRPRSRSPGKGGFD